MISFEVTGHDLDKDLARDRKYKTIVTMIFNGCTISEIAERLSYSNSSVSYHLNKLFKIFKANNRFELIQNFFVEVLERQKQRYEANINALTEDYNDAKNTFKHIRMIINSGKPAEEKIKLIEKVL